MAAVQFRKISGSYFLLGSMVCKICQLKLQKLKAEEEMEWEEAIEDMKDEEYISPLSTIDDTEKEKRREKLDKLTEIFEIDRVHYQLNSNINMVSHTTRNYFRNVFKQIKHKLGDIFCHLVAPGCCERIQQCIIIERHRCDDLFSF